VETERAGEEATDGDERGGSLRGAPRPHAPTRGRFGFVGVVQLLQHRGGRGARCLPFPEETGSLGI
jgi:hypothetical protein